MRQLYLPWSHLTPAERATALRQARRRGALGARADWARCQLDPADSVPIARPTLYVYHLQLLAPSPWHQQWRRLTAAELCEDLRVCHYGDGWEREQRALAGEPALPQDLPTLAGRVTEARENWAASGRARAAAVRRSVALPPGHADRLAAARALMEMDRAQNEYWLAVMLARVAEWEADCPEGTG
jgi:hypothetical protein